MFSVCWGEDFFGHLLVVTVLFGCYIFKLFMELQVGNFDEADLLEPSCVNMGGKELCGFCLSQVFFYQAVYWAVGQGIVARCK